MPPQQTTSPVLHEDLDELLPQEEHHLGHELDHGRTLKISPREILIGLREVEWARVVWKNVVRLSLLHIYSVYGVYLALTHAHWMTWAWSYALYVMSALGITMGAHRLWSHRSFKAKLPLRIVLAAFQTIAFQNSIWEWSRDHRVHHKYSETDADPHDSRRGFFFAHMGWLMTRKHPAVIEKGKRLDLSDLEADPVVRFQRCWYLPLVVTLCFLVPTLVPVLGWGEHWLTALMVAGFLRYTIVLHITWAVNSLAHWVGSKPYDTGIFPSQNPVVAALAMGEGWHNYHHVFPWDYRTAELGGVSRLNGTTLFIDLCVRLGLAYDPKVVSHETILRRKMRTGIHRTKTE